MDFKPKISKEKNGKWKLIYFHCPRSFNTFGMNSTERKRYQLTCSINSHFTSFSDALALLKHLYRNGEIYR